MTLEIGLVIRRDNEGLVRIPFCIGVGLALLAGPALAQKAERPEVKVGDRWQFVRYYSVASTKPNLTWEINSVTETEILGTENGEPLRMTPDLNVVDSPERKQSTPKAHSLPLEPTSARTWPISQGREKWSRARESRVPYQQANSRRSSWCRRAGSAAHHLSTANTTG